MKAALIPCRGYTQTAIQSRYHLVLAQVENRDYRAAYSGLNNSHYIILDNGAAEGQAVSDNQLISQALYYGADEVVVPDVMRDCEQSLERAEQFMKGEAAQAMPCKFMYVVQGRTLAEAYKCIDGYKKLNPQAVLGIPRHLMTTLEDNFARFRIANYILGQFGEEQEVHLLGTNPKWIGEVGQIAVEHPWIRGVDSSAVYNYTIAGKRLFDGEEVHRPDGYFTNPWMLDPQLLKDNVSDYLEWASGTKGTGS